MLVCTLESTVIGRPGVYGCILCMVLFFNTIVNMLLCTGCIYDGVGVTNGAVGYVSLFMEDVDKV